MGRYTLRHLWNHPRYRQYAQQLIFVLVIISIAVLLYRNLSYNLERQNIATGLDFLSQEAGFEIAEASFEYWSDDSYLKAMMVGIVNTLKVSVIGIFLASVIGPLISFGSMSTNWPLKKISHLYIDILRNIPLLLQLFFWYGLFTELLPDIRQAYEPLPGVFLSQRGLYFPSFFDGWRFSLSMPALKGFNFEGGNYLSPEFSALCLGLALYTSSYIAVIVRAGIQSVDKGQWEAAWALGLNPLQTMTNIILPQALKVILPPLTSQYLNLVKNTSLAVGIGYSDFVSIMNTTMNQTGQAIEAVMIIMAVYLFFSLLSSALMNLYAHRINKWNIV